MKKVNTDLLVCLLLQVYILHILIFTRLKFMIGAVVDILRSDLSAMGNASGLSPG